MTILRLFRRKSKALASVVFLALFTSLYAPIVHAVSTATEQPVPVEYNPYKMLADLHLPSVIKQSQEEAQQDEALAKQNVEYSQNLLKIWKMQPIPVRTADKLKLAYGIFANSIKPNTAFAPKIATANTFKDLEMFCGNSSLELDRYVFSHLDNTHTTFGKIELQKMLLEPLDNVYLLEQRQMIIKALVENENLFNSVSKELEIIKAKEASLLWFWKGTSSGFIDAIKGQMFPNFLGMGSLNSSPTALQIRLWFGYLAQAGYFAGLAYFTNKIVRGRHVNDRDLASSWFWALYLGLLSPFIVYTHFLQRKDLNAVHGFMNDVSAVTTSSIQLGTLLGDNIRTKVLFPSYSSLKNVLQPLSAQTVEFVEMMGTNTFKSDPSIFSLQGRAQAAFHELSSIKNNFTDALVSIGQLDAYVAIAKLYKKHQHHAKAQFCFVKYEQAAKPSVTIDQFWLPGLNPDKVVTNSLKLGQASGPSTMVITGPNAGGKSTSLKAITLAILLAQSFGIAPARSMSLTPFSMISTYMNLTDTAGQASLFQAEMRRTSGLIKALQSLRADQFAFLVMDEVFTGTNPKEGQAGAYGVAKKLAGFDNAINIFATHFMVLTELEQVLNGRVKNHKVSVIKNADGSFTFPYLLQPGITNQAIALDLLQQEGFDSDILQAAQEIAARQPKA